MEYARMRPPERRSESSPAGAQQPEPVKFQPSEPRGKKKANKSKKWLPVAVALLALLLLGAWLLTNRGGTLASQIDNNKYQAVFFTSGQVYFGKLSYVNDGYMKLTDVFYIQAQSNNADAKNPQNADNAQGSDLQLIKLGNEIHGPDDAMIISRDQVLFFENLKKDGKVSDSIAKYKQQNK